MIKSLVILSLLCNLTGFNLFSQFIDRKISRNYTTESYSHAKAGESSSVLNSASVSAGSSLNQSVQISAKNYALIDFDSGEILTAKSEHQVVPVASLTKIMTAIVVLENYDLNDVVVVPHEATTQTPTVVFLRQGEKITVGNLLNCLLIRSGNDAAYALASHMDKANQQPDIFVDKMNQKAIELGLINTKFYDASGLSDDGHSTVIELGVITRYALLNKKFRDIVATKKFVATDTSKTIIHSVENSNRLVTSYDYPGAIGVKTGFTYAAGHCLIGAAKRDGRTLISIILNTYSDTANASADEARKLLDFGFRGSSV